MDARSTWFPKCREEAKRLVSGMHLIKAAQFANAFFETFRSSGVESGEHVIM